ncbi:hypothetical protein CMU59_10615 [Elizabethkingia anophelis]|uniref:hypothetical protein n=1 Tax=Elizabethkingia anophelis TaxID=1117645 RepID=UPI0020129A8D|nr:hypothetical protein [Elizabethkingia anophelis]MCL1688995.1 hypothetical protein [Elizabethkingia anophelis]MDV3574162.1 hypothetical protein [Elizabethkingia anophelis]MDV3600878.1 hypothetical protein [Elizabethkingia anophelis]MDV3606756.1 hypothetical protein [Elizabethkingia anophelis]MDV3639093.1 hypothetical protein [Elizabethkingia anophelis]
MEEATLNSIRNRPRFKFSTKLSPVEYEQHLLEMIRANPLIHGKINREVASIWVNNNIDNYWKPYLAIRIEKSSEKEDHTEIRGIFGPSSAVWTFFMFLYFLFGIFFMVFISLYYVEIQIKTENYPWAIHASIACIVLILLTWMASQFGQKLAKKEIEILRKFAEETSDSIEVKKEESL